MKSSFLLAAAFACAGSISSASTVTVTDVSGKWLNVSGGTNVTGLGTASVSWGQPFPEGGSQSGYTFAGQASESREIGTEFQMGTLTHNNFEIDDGTSIYHAQLQVSFSFFIDDDAANLVTRSSTFDFGHWETPNAADPCANGLANRQGVNQNGCADRVQVETNPTYTETFTIAGVLYSFSVTGFNSGTEFWTTESQSNQAHMFGRLTAAQVPSQVPLPAAGWMLLACLGGLFGLRKFGRAD